MYSENVIKIYLQIAANNGNVKPEREFFFKTDTCRSAEITPQRTPNLLI